MKKITILVQVAILTLAVAGCRSAERRPIFESQPVAPPSTRPVLPGSAAPPPGAILQPAPPPGAVQPPPGAFSTAPPFSGPSSDPPPSTPAPGAFPTAPPATQPNSTVSPPSNPAAAPG